MANIGAELKRQWRREKPGDIQAERRGREKRKNKEMMEERADGMKSIS